MCSKPLIALKYQQLTPYYQLCMYNTFNSYNVYPIAANRNIRAAMYAYKTAYKQPMYISNHLIIYSILLFIIGVSQYKQHLNDTLDLDVWTGKYNNISRNMIPSYEQDKLELIELSYELNKLGMVWVCFDCLVAYCLLNLINYFCNKLWTNHITASPRHWSNAL